MTPDAAGRWRLWPRGLGARLTVALLCLTAVGLFAFGAAGTTLLRHSMIDEVDGRLGGLRPAEGSGVDLPAPTDPWEPPAPLGSGTPDRPPLDQSDRTAPPFPTELRSLELDASGRVRSVVGVTPDDDALPDLSGWGVAELLAARGEPFTAPSTRGDGSWRVLALPREEGGVHVTAQSLDEVDDTLGRLVVIETVVGLALLVVLGAGAVAIVRLQLRPLREIERTAGAIAGGDLDRRVPALDPATEPGRLGAALNTMLGELAQALRERDRSAETTKRFVADASHELRTPLSSIVGFAALHRQGRDRGVVAEDPRTERWMSLIEEEAQRMGAMVDNLLVLSRFDETPHLQPGDVELGEIAERVTRAARVRAPETPIGLDVPEPVLAVADGERVRQVLENLVGNALHHTPPGTPVSVAVRRAPRPPAAAGPGAGTLPAGVGEVALLTVRDEGPGIPAAELPRLFDRFYRATGTPGGRSGAGLGLAISAAFVAAHDGRLTVASAEGRGTEFTVALPLG
ncbi:two-component system, OmpR family, sensor kinase [Streptomyces zhaozhouensis]|uniref:histidine kinase n=1 Tax=Streptomyces zhaozhouensis TaxID=1300267 RepID=A0A286E746_9ACTN|nr:HAMP domain-containing sensor histidine kinase [Streptomyces zhaozhouensis]SOD66720.1 two-component system, OmpR family, sensor kinase [Streptomyces zhaozhouensis]